MDIFVYIIIGILLAFMAYAMHKASVHKKNYNYIHDKAIYELNKEMSKEHCTCIQPDIKFKTSENGQVAYCTKCYKTMESYDYNA